MVHLLLQLTPAHLWHQHGSRAVSARNSAMCQQGRASIVAFVLSFLALVVVTHEATINTINTKHMAK